jgi:malonyl-CoA O-methyltransferase
LDCGEVSIVIKEFDRFAKNYSKYNIIQQEVAKELVSLVDISFKSAIDIGAGTGTLYKELIKKFSPKKFIAIDSSSNMLNLHPKKENIKLIKADFNSKEFEKILSSLEFDIAFSSSALQWAVSLDFTFRAISKNSREIFFAIFTSNTFKTLHKEAKTTSPIHSKENLKKSIEKFFNPRKLYIKEYQLFFQNKEEIFEYIKKSGVSGGQKRISIKELRRLKKEYPKNYLEFEVMFVVASSKNSFSKL